jgi:hypothetical protein
MKKYLIISVLFVLSFQLSGQDNKISLQFNRILFRNLADTLEKTVPVKIYYANKWVDSLYLKIYSNNDSITNLFDKSLENTGQRDSA